MRGRGGRGRRPAGVRGWVKGQRQQEGTSKGAIRPLWSGAREGRLVLK